MPNERVSAWIAMGGVSAAEHAASGLAGRYIAKRFPSRRGAFVGAAVRHAPLIRDLAEFAVENRERPVEALADTMRIAMRPLEDEIRANTPVGTGRLKRSVATKVSAKPSTSGAGTHLLARTGWIGDQPRRRATQYAVEYGTREDREGERVIRNAVEGVGQTISRQLPELLKAQMEETLAAEQKSLLAQARPFRLAGIVIKNLPVSRLYQLGKFGVKLIRG